MLPVVLRVQYLSENKVSANIFERNYKKKHCHQIILSFLSSYTALGQFAYHYAQGSFKSCPSPELCFN